MTIESRLKAHSAKRHSDTNATHANKMYAWVLPCLLLARGIALALQDDMRTGSAAGSRRNYGIDASLEHAVVLAQDRHARHYTDAVADRISTLYFMYMALQMHCLLPSLDLAR